MASDDVSPAERARLDQFSAQLGVPALDDGTHGTLGAYVAYCDGDCVDEVIGTGDDLDEVSNMATSHLSEVHDEADEEDEACIVVMTREQFENNGVFLWLAGQVPNLW